MRPTWQALSGLAVAALLASGCETAPPGAGFTNPEAGKIGSEKAGDRTDLPTPNMTRGDSALTEGADARATAGESATDQAAGSSPAPAPGAGPGAPGPRSSPPTREVPAGAQGATKPTGTIETGTPRSPQ